ncbi:hypothetical protein OHR68_19860 [Spirillospora sp. NBC_00431]
MLVQTEVLPERHEDLERVPAWLEHHLADKPVEHANLVRPFLHWHLRRRARSRASRRAYRTTAGRELRRRIPVALDLLAWSDASGTTLAELRQDDLDRWLDEENSQRRNRVRYFLGWTADRGLSRRLRRGWVFRAQPFGQLTERQRFSGGLNRGTHQAGEADGDLFRGYLVGFGVRWLTVDHEPIAAHMRGVVDHHGQPFQQAGVAFEIVNEGTEPRRIHLCTFGALPTSITAK